MKIIDQTIRNINVYIEPHEIIHMIINKLRDEYKIEFTQFDQFKFEFVEEGSPSYKTGKIKCVVSKNIKETPPASDK